MSLVALVALVACGGGGGTTTAAAPTPCPTDAVADSRARLVAPAPGATGVSPLIGSITFAYGNADLPFAQILLTPGDGSNSVSTIPTNFTTPPPAAGVITLPIPALKPATTYTVTAFTLNFAHLPCFRQVTGALGSFTTS
ncbi:MAG: hypothetical protein M3154_11900 [Candidatus Eremiobacteraeota bacterium]|nr:hypothetical protein [Candidatus Eremiobacteraeota bacterium]